MQKTNFSQFEKKKQHKIFICETLYITMLIFTWMNILFNLKNQFHQIYLKGRIWDYCYEPLSILNKKSLHCHLNKIGLFYLYFLVLNMNEFMNFILYFPLKVYYEYYPVSSISYTTGDVCIFSIFKVFIYEVY